MRVAADAVMFRIPQLDLTELSETVVIQGKSLEVGDTDSVAISSKGVFRFFWCKILKENLTISEH